jgi:hypothetical protein
MNPYTRRGRAGRFSWSLYESLLETSGPFGDSAPADVYGEYYGLLAHTVEYPPSKDWVIFHMRPEARFSDGTPVTAHDVVFTHNLFLEQGLPSYAEAVGYRVTNAEALDDHTVRYEFREDISRRSLIDQVGATPVFSQAWFEETGARLDESRLETSPGSGPYVLDGFEINRRITYRRNPDYWGWDLPNNQGRHNFDVVRVEYFADDTAAFEAFKTGEYTFRTEGNSRQWAIGYDFPAVGAGMSCATKSSTGRRHPPPASSSTSRGPCSRTARARGGVAGVQLRMDQPADAARADVAALLLQPGHPAGSPGRARGRRTGPAAEPRRSRARGNPDRAGGHGARILDRTAAGPAQPAPPTACSRKPAGSWARTDAAATRRARSCASRCPSPRHRPRRWNRSSRR